MARRFPVPRYATLRIPGMPKPFAQSVSFLLSS